MTRIITTCATRFTCYYMDIKGNTVERMTEDELAAVHKKYWGY